MKRALLASSRRCSRQLSTHVATAAEVPDDPDILTTQNAEFSQTTHAPDRAVDISDGSTSVSGSYPRLQYRSPALGVNPAYDLALELIKQNKAQTKQKHQSTRAKIARLEQSGDAAKASVIKDLKVYQRQLEDLIDMNDPEIHWRHARGDVDLSMPIYRYLARKKWSERQLHLLMQRVTQMSVTPDVIPFISPTVDVRLNFPGRTKGERRGTFEVGELLVSLDSRHLPNIDIQSFGDTARKYSLAILDPDVPDETNDSFKNYLHYLQTDITLGPTDHKVESSNGKVIYPYVPPHPEKGTPYHRYTMVVWEQPEPTSSPDKSTRTPSNHGSTTAIPAQTPTRDNFDAQEFARRNGLHAVGISFWRQVWDSDVSRIMANFPEVGYEEKNYRRIKA